MTTPVRNNRFGRMIMSLDPMHIDHYDAEEMDLDELVQNLRKLVRDAPTSGHWTADRIEAALVILSEVAHLSQLRTERLTPEMRDEIRRVCSGFFGGEMMVEYNRPGGGMGLKWDYKDTRITATDITEMRTAELIELRDYVIEEMNWNPATGDLLGLIGSELAVRAALSSFGEVAKAADR